MDYIILALVSFAVGWVAREVVALRRVKKFLQTLEEIEQESLNVKEDSIKIKVEIDDSGRFYAYYDEDSRFLAQGDTYEALVGNIKAWHPNKTFAIVKAPGMSQP